MQIIPDFPLGGAETMCQTLSCTLSAMGHSVTVVSLYRCDTILTKKLNNAKIPVYYLDKKPGLDLNCIPKLRKLIREQHPDVIHTHIHALKYAFAASLGLGIPMLRTIHSIASQDAEADTSINRFLFLHRFVTPVAISDAIAQTVSEYYRIPSHDIPVVLNGVDFSRSKPKQSYALQSPAQLIHVGRFCEVKNHECILHALAALKEKGCFPHLKLFGSGELLDTIRSLSHSLGLSDQVEFCGLTDNIYPYLSDADIFLLPSKWEGIPMSIIEAMGTGLPIIAANVGGIPDMLTDRKSGILISPDAQSLSSALTELLADADLRQHLGQAAKQASAAFSAEAMANDYLTLYQKLIPKGHTHD